MSECQRGEAIQQSNFKMRNNKHVEGGMKEATTNIGPADNPPKIQACSLTLHNILGGRQ